MTDVTVNTGDNSKKRGQFVHNDPRINRRGRPRSFDQLRKLAVQVAAEQNEEGITRVLEILRDWAKSKEVAKQDKFMAYTYGKPKDEVDITTAGEKIIVKLVKDEDAPS
jgi:effector-binding domain-containing protein